MPLLRPIRKPVNRVTRMLVEPTAPSAVEPANRPTTATSDMLNSTCSRLESASGRLTRKICFARGPSVRDVVVDFIFSFFLCLKQNRARAHRGTHLLYKGAKLLQEGESSRRTSLQRGLPMGWEPRTSKSHTGAFAMVLSRHRPDRILRSIKNPRHTKKRPLVRHSYRLGTAH